MKRILLLCLSVLLVIGFPTTGQAAPSIQAESYIMTDAVTGKILLQSEADVSLPLSFDDKADDALSCPTTD
ncbi:hypothetical protein OVA29_00230 [Exiguobacterium sp. SL14]|nr:hypothetical protein [Exiguobacterium sp. SL14]MCY1689503.1 hypothetical protein [Exiguobacterium sp. SL14]